VWFYLTDVIDSIRNLSSRYFLFLFRYSITFSKLCVDKVSCVLGSLLGFHLKCQRSLFADVGNIFTRHDGDATSIPSEPLSLSVDTLMTIWSYRLETLRFSYILIFLVRHSCVIRYPRPSISVRCRRHVDVTCHM
jgi:hypothetical protein